MQGKLDGQESVERAISTSLREDGRFGTDRCITVGQCNQKKKHSI